MDEAAPFVAGDPERFSRARATAWMIRLNFIRGLFTSALRGCVTLCLCLVVIPVLLCLAFLPIVTAILSWDAPCDRPLATFLLIYGIVPKNMYPPQDSGRVTRLAYATVNLFNIVWFVQGCVWTFSTSTKTCDPTLFLVSYWILVVTLIIISLLLLLLAIFLILVRFFLVPVMAASGRHGLTEEQLDGLKPHDFSQGMMTPEDAQCAICLNSYAAGEPVLTLPCKHHFHDSCAKIWLRGNSTCPFCRKEVLGSPQTSPDAAV